MLQPSEHEIEDFNVAPELPVRERAEYQRIKLSTLPPAKK